MSSYSFFVVKRRNTIVGLFQQGHRSWGWGLNHPLKICSRDPSMFPLKCHIHSFKTALHIKYERIVSKMEGKTNFSRCLQAVRNRYCWVFGNHWLEIACIDPHQTGFVVEGNDHLQLNKFWPSRAPGKGSAAGRKFSAPSYHSQCAVFASPWAFFSFILQLCHYFVSKCLQYTARRFGRPRSHSPRPCPLLFALGHTPSPSDVHYAWMTPVVAGLSWLSSRLYWCLGV